MVRLLVMSVSLMMTSTAEAGRISVEFQLREAARGGPLSGNRKLLPDLSEYLIGAEAMVDPLGRGVWVVDEELNQVALLPEAMEPVRFDVGDWPERLLVTPSGHVFVTCRGAGTVDVIGPTYRRSTVTVGAGPKALAFDGVAGELHVALVAGRAVVTLPRFGREVMWRAELDYEPSEIAAGSAGVFVAPSHGDFIEHLADGSRASLPSTGRRAWHPQALLPVAGGVAVVYAGLVTGMEPRPERAPTSSLSIMDMSADPEDLPAPPRPSSKTAHTQSRKFEVAPMFIHGSRLGGYGGGPLPRLMQLALVEFDRHDKLVATALRNLPASDVGGLLLTDESLWLASPGMGRVFACDNETGRTGGRGAQVHCTSKFRTGVGTATLMQGRRGLLAYSPFERRVTEFVTDNEPNHLALGAGNLDEEMALGRELFHGSINRRTSTRGFACIHCHPDGMQDGLVWRQGGMPRQTPMLAGRLKDTGPFHWVGSADSLTVSINETTHRLGGIGLRQHEQEALARYIREGLRHLPSAPSPSAELVSRGKAIFHDPEAACNDCHDSETSFTSGGVHDVGTATLVEHGLEYDPPSLTYLARTAPYFHDGSVATLEELIANNHDRMGKTSHLSSQDQAALVAYLRSL